MAAREIFGLNRQLENRNKFLNQVFGKYFSDDVVEEILNDPNGALLGGKRRVVTVLLSDLRGFSAISEGLEPSDLTDMLNNYFSSMEEIIVSHRGTIIEFMGDGILAVFGAGADPADHERDAVCCALQMQNAMEGVNEYNLSRKYPILMMGIGLDSGEAYVGNIGSEKMMRYNVIGRVVSRCSRIESYTVGGQVFASGRIADAVPGLLTGPIRNVMAKGISEPLSFYEIKACGDITNTGANHKAKMYVPGQTAEFCLYVVEDKKIGDRAYHFTVLGAGKIEIAGRLEDGVTLEPYSDVCLEGTVMDNGYFNDLYGKITGISDGVYRITITHAGETVTDWIKECEENGSEY